MIIKSITFAALLVAASGAIAAQPSVWINLGGASYHPGSNGALNDSNPGLGLEYHRNNGDYLAAGMYLNSIGKRSRYGVYARQLASSGAVSLGVFGGIVDGYTGINNGGIIPFGAPYMSINGDRVGVNVIFIPGINPKVNSVFSVQFKLRIQ